MDAYKSALGLAYRRRGRSELVESELRHVLSFEFGWFSPSVARAFIEEALRLGYLESRNGALVPAFDVTAIEVAVDFRPPSPAGVDSSPVRERIQGTLRDARVSGLEVAEELALLEARTAGMLSKDVLALLLLARRGVDVRALSGDLLDVVANARA